MRRLQLSDVVVLLCLVTIIVLAGIFISWYPVIGIVGGLVIGLTLLELLNRRRSRKANKATEVVKESVTTELRAVPSAGTPTTQEFPTGNSGELKRPVLVGLTQEDFDNIVLPRLASRKKLTDPNEKIMRVVHAHKLAIVPIVTRVVGVIIGIVLLGTAGVIGAHSPFMQTRVAHRVVVRPHKHHATHKKSANKKHQTKRHRKGQVQDKKTPIVKTRYTTKDHFHLGLGLILLLLGLLVGGGSIYDLVKIKAWDQWKFWKWTYWIISTRYVYITFLTPDSFPASGINKHDFPDIIEGAFDAYSWFGLSKLKIGVVTIEYPGDKQNLVTPLISDPSGFVTDVEPLKRRRIS